MCDNEPLTQTQRLIVAEQLNYFQTLLETKDKKYQENIDKLKQEYTTLIDDIEYYENEKKDEKDNDILSLDQKKDDVKRTISDEILDFKRTKQRELDDELKEINKSIRILKTEMRKDKENSREQKQNLNKQYQRDIRQLETVYNEERTSLETSIYNCKKW